MSFRRAFLPIVGLIFSACAVSSSFAADWPTRPIRFIVPYAVGGGTDLVARMVGAKLSEALKQPVVVENKLGANGAIAVEYVAKAPADGYTVLFDSLSIVITPIVFKVPYDPVRDLQPVAKLISQAYIVVATPKLPLKNLRDVVTYSMSTPNGLNAAAPGAGSNLVGELFKLLTNARITLVPYKGGALAALAVMSGETDMGFMDVPSVATNVTGGRVNGLAVTTEKRVALIPDVPTSAEAGIPEFKVESWLGAFARANTPADIVTSLNSEVNTALGAPEVVAKIRQIGGEPAPTTIAEFTKLYRAEIVRWKDVVVRAKVKVE